MLDWIEWIQALPVGLIYVSLGFSAWFENIFPPIPGDTITGLGAFLVATRRLSFWGVFVSTTIGSTSGFMTLFFLARGLGRDFFVKRDFRYFPRDALLKAEERFKVQGYLVVLLNRFLPGIRSVISIATGLLRLNVTSVLILSLVSSSLWNLLWIYTGYSLGTNWDVAKTVFNKLIRDYNIVAGVVLFLAVLVYFYLKRR